MYSTVIPCGNLRFLVDKTQSKDRFIRLGFAGMSTDNIELGLKLLFE